MRRPVLCLALLLTVACGSLASRPVNVPQPSIVTRSVGSIFFGSGNSAPVYLEVAVTNHASVPLRVRNIEIRSLGMVHYTLQPVRRLFNETIPPGQTRTLSLITSAYTTVRNPGDEPLSLRTMVTMEAEGKPFREIVH